MNTEITINKNSGQNQTKASGTHPSDAEIEKMAKEWVELLIDHIMCPIEKQMDNTSSPLSFTH